MCDQTFVAITFGPCESCSQNKPLMNIYLQNEPVNYCSLCVELLRRVWFEATKWRLYVGRYSGGLRQACCQRRADNTNGYHSKRNTQWADGASSAKAPRLISMNVPPEQD
ncbi:hypothetical protein AOLI_G00102340 [Acnodon oligacanthus]